MLGKKKILTLCFFLLILLVGMFTQYQFLKINAEQKKWKFGEYLSGDNWYCYVNSSKDSLYIENDQDIENKFVVNVLDEQEGYEVYQYTWKAWETFQYECRDGRGFTKKNTNEIIVSKGLSFQYPIGSVMNIKWGDESAEYEVVGVLEADDIVAPYKNSTEGASLWNSNADWNDATMDKLFCILHPSVKVKKTHYQYQSIFSNQKVQNSLHGLSVSQLYKEAMKKCRITVAKGSVLGFLVLLAIISIVIWNRVLLCKSSEDICYLKYIGMSNIMIASIFFRINAIMVGSASILSFLTIYFPNDYKGYWKMTTKTAVVSMLAYILIWVISVMADICICRKIDYKMIKEIPCVEEFTLMDNLCLYLETNGYSAKRAKSVALMMLDEKELSFLAKRKMGNLNREQIHIFKNMIS